MNNNSNKSRPVFLNLFKIHLPIPGIVSLAHRASGVLLFFSIPFAVYLLDLSIVSPQGFQRVQHVLHQPMVVIALVFILWAFVHHFFAGLRFLMIDADIGIEKIRSRQGAWLVIITEIIVLLLIIYGVVR